MANLNPDNQDLFRACWRCQHFGGVVSEVHASCLRGSGSLQASPVSGCVFWLAGSGDAQAIEWMPEGLRLAERRLIWGSEPSAPPPLPPGWESGRPGLPTDAEAWDRQQEQQAWRATDSVLSQFRCPRREGDAMHANVQRRLSPNRSQPPYPGPDDQPATLPV